MGTDHQATFWGVPWTEGALRWVEMSEIALLCFWVYMCIDVQRPGMHRIALLCVALLCFALLCLALPLCVYVYMCA